MGFILGAIGGMADATAELSKMRIKEMAEREKVQAMALREQELAKWESGQADARLERRFTFDREQNILDREHEAEQNSLNRASEEKRAAMRAGARSKPIKIGEDDMGRPIFGVYNDDTQEIEPVGVAGTGSVDADLSPAELDRARVELSTAGGKDRGNDWIPFNEPSEDQVKARAYENRKGGKGEDTKSAGKTANDYYTFLKNKYPDRSDADIRARVKERFGDDGSTVESSPGKRTPNQRQIQALRENPDKADQFDALFGSGASKEYLLSKGKGGIIGSAMSGNLVKPGTNVDRLVSLMEEQRRNRSSTTKEHLAAARLGREAAQSVHQANRVGTDHQLSTEVLRLALASGQLNERARQSVEAELSRRGKRQTTR